MRIHWPSLFSFHSETLLSPPVTARTLPVVDQEMLHTASSNVCSTVDVHCERSELLLQMITWRSCDADAICRRGKPIDGAHATSRTQSECASRRCSSVHRSLSSRQILTRLSHPPLTKRLMDVLREVTRWSKAASGPCAGHQEIAFTPIVCAFGIFLASQTPYSVLQVNTEMEPSELAHASTSPYSDGAKSTEFTEESWLLYSYLKCGKIVMYGQT